MAGTLHSMSSSLTKISFRDGYYDPHFTVVITEAQAVELLK